MVALNSSNLASAEYDAGTRTLTIDFTSGDTYRYSNVPKETAAALFSAPSKGSYFHRQIKGIYPAEQV